MVSGTDLDFAWAAGFFDGEGCINITKRFASYKKINGENSGKYRG